jgi:hypothetical protein
MLSPSSVQTPPAGSQKPRSCYRTLSIARRKKEEVASANDQIDQTFPYPLNYAKSAKGSPETQHPG